MAWKEVSLEQIATSFKIDLQEIKEKHRLIELIKKTRVELGLSQLNLSKKVGVSQSRIAQVESRMGTAKVSFELLLSILRKMGYDYKIVTRRAA